MSSGSICPLTANALVILLSVGLVIETIECVWVCVGSHLEPVSCVHILMFTTCSEYKHLCIFEEKSSEHQSFILSFMVHFSFFPPTSGGWLQSPHNWEWNLINLTVTPGACDHRCFPNTQEGDVELNLCYSDELTIEQFNAPVITKHFGHGSIFQLCHTGFCQWWWLSPGILGLFALPNFVFSDAD